MPGTYGLPVALFFSPVFPAPIPASPRSISPVSESTSYTPSETLDATKSACSASSVFGKSASTCSRVLPAHLQSP